MARKLPAAEHIEIRKTMQRLFEWLDQDQARQVYLEHPVHKGNALKSSNKKYS